VEKFENQLDADPASETVPKEKAEPKENPKEQSDPVLNHTRNWKDPKINSKIFRGLLVS
jgi:hypothetical protein